MTIGSHRSFTSCRHCWSLGSVGWSAIRTEPACSNRWVWPQSTTAASAASGRVQFRQVPGCDGGAGTSTTAAGPAGPGSAANVPSTGTVAPANVSRVATASIVSAPTSTPYTIRRYGIVARSGVLGAGGAGRGARRVRSMTTVIMP